MARRASDGLTMCWLGVMVVAFVMAAGALAFGVGVLIAAMTPDED